MRDYIAQLQQRGEVIVVETPVDPKFELAAVTQRLQQKSDKVILFRNVIGASMPVVSNIYGSRRRLCEMIAATDGNFCRRWTAVTRQKTRSHHHKANANTEYPRVSEPS
jgi:UbiD family decarboxylase